MVADAMEKVTGDGVITIEESKTMKTELKAGATEMRRKPQMILSKDTTDS